MQKQTFAKSGKLILLRKSPCIHATRKQTEKYSYTCRIITSEKHLHLLQFLSTLLFGWTTEIQKNYAIE